MIDPAQPTPDGPHCNGLRVLVAKWPAPGSTLPGDREG